MTFGPPGPRWMGFAGHPSGTCHDRHNTYMLFYHNSSKLVCRVLGKMLLKGMDFEVHGFTAMI